MAATTVITNFRSRIVGAVLKLAAVGVPDTVVNGAGDALTELIDMPGYYACTVTAAVSGRHLVTIQDPAGVVRANWEVDLQDDTGTYFTGERSVLSAGAHAGANVPVAGVWYCNPAGSDGNSDPLAYAVVPVETETTHE